MSNKIIIAASPMRVSLFGGGTDFENYWSMYGGSVISLAINKYAYVIVKKRFGKDIYLHWKVRETVSNVNNLKHEIIKEALKKTNINGIDIVCLSDISQIGTGLGSSSAFTASTMMALSSYKNLNINKKILVKETIDIENNILKKPIGIQDQYISVYGSFRRFYFRRNGNVNNHLFNGKTACALSKNLYLIPTGQYRKAETVLSEQKKNINKNIINLREINNLTNKAHKYINNSKFDELGYLLHESWEIKKQLASNVSNKNIDKIYTECLLSGAIGGKLCGAGNGGFLLMFVPKSNKKKFEEINLGRNFIKFKPDNAGTKIILN